MSGSKRFSFINPIAMKILCGATDHWQVMGASSVYKMQYFIISVKKPEQDPDKDYIFIIDEINRGNLSQIFGELLVLIEADKRGARFAVPLMYRHPNEERFFVPTNLHIIGLMNLADRSLAIVDYALRRRFAFMTLTPKYGSIVFRTWLEDRNMDPELINLIVKRINALNQEINNDSLLGENYMVGHSFFCPKGSDFSGLDRSWYDGIIETEIVPLIKEYWFDNADRVVELRERLACALNSSTKRKGTLQNKNWNSNSKSLAYVAICLEIDVPV